MKFKVWDKVRCIKQWSNYYDANYLTIGREYEILDITNWILPLRILADKWLKLNVDYDLFELVQEDKLPHELLWLPRYRVVGKDESDPLWSLFFDWFNGFYGTSYRKDRNFYWYDWWNGVAKSNSNDYIEYFKNNPTLITLQERDRCVNKKQSQTKKLSKPIRSCEYNWSTYMEDTIDWVSIEDMKQTRDNINKQLLTHRNLFSNPNKKSND